MPDDHSYSDDADLHGEDAYDDEYRDEYASDDVVGHEEYREDEYGDDEYTEYDPARNAPDEDEGSWWDEGLIGLLLVSGIVLFFFPEPITSTIGMALLALGVIAWAADALT